MASCWREALICIALASKDAAVCAVRFAMWELMVMAMILAVSLPKMLSSSVLLANPAKRLQDA